MTKEHKFSLKKEVRGTIPLSNVVTEFFDSPLSIVDKDRMIMLYQLALLTKSIDGEVAEVGVYKGGTARVVASIFSHLNKKIHLCDTFNGMPPTAPVDLHYEGAFNDVSFEEVKQYLVDYLDSVVFHVGIFPQSFENSPSKFCFVHVDCDIYQSVIDCCHFFYPKMSKGGIMLFDDYGSLSTPGAKLAVDSFCERNNIKKVYLSTGQCFIVR